MSKTLRIERAVMACVTENVDVPLTLATTAKEPNVTTSARVTLPLTRAVSITYQRKNLVREVLTDGVDGHAKPTKVLSDANLVLSLLLNKSRESFGISKHLDSLHGAQNLGSKVDTLLSLLLIGCLPSIHSLADCAGQEQRHCECVS
jgi:hypothetical protein